jgi:hypothetical protein
MEIEAGNALRAEKRSAGRFEIDAACRVLANDGSDGVANVHDISTSGVGIRFAQGLTIGRRYMLAIEPRRDPHMRRLNALGTVVYCELFGNTFRIGLKFVDIDPCSRLRLQALEKETG